ncbi:hypothetical protein JW998_08690, partial [candidate division KSB1 bacterium]|nr:hypothetical protein [candidate division KSB1 bacterium]
LGIRWWGEKKFFIRDELVDGVNQLEIRVTTTLFNYVQSLDNAVVKYWLERRKNKGLVSAGLLGPVRLAPIKSTKRSNSQ